MKRRKNYKRKSIKRRKILRKGGDCGCNKNPLWGGNSIASFNSDLQPNQYYPLNPHLNESIDPAIIVDTRNLANMNSTMGGKKRSKKNGKKVRISKKIVHIKGGGISDFFLGSNPQNNFLSSATSPGILDTYNTYMVNNTVNSAPFSQPALSMYNDFNKPLA